MASLDCLKQEDNKNATSGKWEAGWKGDDNGTVTDLLYILCVNIDNRHSVWSA